jgi:putative PIN family toxin of toxin-antitoxin system
MKAPPGVVLDTNVVLSALIFSRGWPQRIRLGWQSGRFVPLGSTATVHELLRTIAYPKFRLTGAEQDELLADYLPWVRVVRIPAPPPAVPECRDPSDIPFLHLAAAGGAHALVTGDRDLLAVKRSSSLFQVMGVQAFCASFLEE